MHSRSHSSYAGRTLSDDWEVVKQLYEAIFRAGGATDRHPVCGSADQLIASGTHVLVCGNTASGDQEKALQLSGKRAAVITSELISCGVPAEQIDKTIGFGHGDPYVRNDLDDSGNQVEALAKSNRTVVIESATSETGRKILSGKWEYIS